MAWEHGDACEVATSRAGIPILIWSFVIGVLTFAIPAGRYASDDRPGETIAPTDIMIALHWMFVFGGVLLGVGFAVFWFGGCMLAGFLSITCLYWVVCWGTYIGVFYSASIWTDNLKSVSLAEFKEMYSNAVNATAKDLTYRIEMRSRKRARKGSRVCYTAPIVLQIKDGTEILDASEDIDWSAFNDGVFLMKTSVNFYTDETSTLKLANWRSVFGKCLQASTTGDPVINMMPTVANLQTNVLVTSDGKIPTAIKRGAGGVAAFFGAGIVWLYDFARIVRVSRVTINKHVTLDIESMNYDYSCTDVPYCYT